MTLETPLGPAWAEIDPAGNIQAFGFGPPPPRAAGHSAPLARQVAEYCEGRRTRFELNLRPVGTPFQQRVWAELLKIPYGHTITYLELSHRAGVPGAARAVGRANATNPLALIVPCHRVIGSNGTLTGYAYGTDLKRRLLHLESHPAR